MDTLRLMLLALLIGASVSTSPTYSQDGLSVSQTIVMPQPQIQVTVQPTAQPTATPRPTAIPRPTTTRAPINTGTFITRQLYKGCTGDDVLYLQRWLANLGYSVTADGNFGEQTRQAVLRFQQNNGLTADGIAGEKTIRRLVSSAAVPETGWQWRTLSYGMSGQDVSSLQARLQELGYYSGSVTGRFLESTQEAVLWFQRVHGLTADGVAGRDTLSLLYSDAACPAGTVPSGSLSEGDRGEAVLRLQTRLYRLNYLPAADIDGYFGSATREAVYAFQENNDLYRTGVADTTTQALLYSSAARPYPGTTPRPTASPTAPPTAPPTTCSHCGQAITAGTQATHTTLAACGTHYQCQTGNHTPAACGTAGHYNCDGNDHSVASCGTAGHYNCGGNNHSVASCGTAGHYNCDGKDHTPASCGTAGHYNCDDKDHTSKYPCNYHYVCYPSAAEADHTTSCKHCNMPKCTWPFYDCTGAAHGAQ